jgi:hypothetical protein
MRKIFIVLTSAAAFAALAPAAQAQERTVTGAAIGAGAGAVIAGPPGAVVGGVAGAVIGGPRISGRTYARGTRTCWRDRKGVRHCRYR